MKKPLPSRPNLEQLKKQAKDLLKLHETGNAEALRRIAESHPQTDEVELSLADAQLVVAREYGFESWPKLKVHVEALARGEDPVVAAFIEAVYGGHQKQAEKLVAEHPSLAQATPYTAAILGEADVLERMLAEDEGLATRPAGPKNWPPLLYAAFSKFHRENQKIAEGIVAIAKMLLARGAGANTMYTWQEKNDWKLSALWGATCVANNPGLARVLLEGGANPNDGESVYHSAENYHFECLGVLAEFDANISGPIQPWNNTPLYFILGHRPTKGNAKQVFEGARWLLEHGADPNVSSYDIEGRPIHLAASAGWGTDMFDLLLKHGADLMVRRKDVTSVPPATSHTLRPDPVALVGGTSAYALAARYGQTHAMDWLREHGAQTELTPIEEFFAACGRGDEPAVRAILAAQPELIRLMSDEDKLVLAFAAGDGKTEAVRLMLLAGVSMGIRGDAGGTPLHQAAWHGQLDVVKLLLAHHAPLEEKDTTYGGTPLGWACHGSENCRNPRGNYPGIAEALIKAGAKFEAPAGTEEVKEVMRRYGDPSR